MLLSKLLHGIIHIDKKNKVDILGLSLDSRFVKKGDLFFALNGHINDGRKFIKDAFDKGAHFVLSESDYPDLRSKVSQIASRFYNDPTKDIDLIGVTGTNGKTTISYLVSQACNLLNIKSGLIGTLGCGFLDCLNDCGNTTPDAIYIQKISKKLKNEECKLIAMEVSSHALEQHRIDGCFFDVAVFTNLTHDHLDYHLNMENYFLAKERLFKFNSIKHGVVNIDDEFGSILHKKYGSKIMTYSLSNKNADIYVLNRRFSMSGISAIVILPEGKITIESSLIGEFNLSNLLAVIGVLLHLNINIYDISNVIKRLIAPPGRMQLVDCDEFKAVVDYAHTPDALEKILIFLKEIINVGGKIITVFGCGGDRDISKRAVMGKIASKYSDVIILTNDNPRFEDELNIINDIKSGINNVKTIVETDRKKAIKFGCSIASKGDLLLVAGKGHENYQIIKNEKIYCNDVDFIKN